jgi:hypothetical protein
VKLIKTAVIVAVLSLAAYGTYALLKKPPQLNVSGDDIKYLEELGVSVQDGQASDGGLSGVLNNVEGAPPVGSVVQPSEKTSSAPPAFFGTPTPKTAAPPFSSNADSALVPVAVEPAPLVAAAPLITTFDEPAESGEQDVKAEVAPVPAPAEEPAAPQHNNPLRIQHTPETLPPEPVKPPKNSEEPQQDAPAISSIPAESWDGPAATVVYAGEPQYTAPIPESPPPLPASLQKETSPGSYVVPPAVRIKPLPKIQQLSDEKTARLQPADEFGSSGVVPIPAVSADAPIKQLVYQQSAQNIVQARYDERGERPSVAFAAPKPEKATNDAVVSFSPPQKQYKTTEEKPASNKPLISPVIADTKPLVAAEVKPDAALKALPEARTPAVQFIEKQRAAAETSIASPDGAEKVRKAFVQLSRYLEQQPLNEAERNLIIPILDKFALDVIYAKNTHILELPYTLKNGETIETVASAFALTPQLLRKINGLTGSQQPAEGAKIKVLAGQFDAVISRSRSELTLLLGGLYAGRFPVVIGNQALDNSGEFYIVSKSEAKVLTLNNGIIVGGSVVSSLGSPGRTIQLQDAEAREVFDILSERSVIVLE